MAPDVGKSGQQQNQDENKKKHVWLLQFGPRVIARDVLRIATQIGDEWNSRDQQLERATQPSGARNRGHAKMRPVRYHKPSSNEGGANHTFQ